MADPGDTAALCNDTKNHSLVQQQPEAGQPEAGQPEEEFQEPDLEAGCVGGDQQQQPQLQQPEKAETEELVEGEGGEEGTAAGSDGQPSGSEKKSSESKWPFIYFIVEPGCTPLSCYSAILTFIVMSCGVFWLLLISPPVNAKAHNTRLPWLMNLEVNTTDTTDVDIDNVVDVGSGDGLLDVGMFTNLATAPAMPVEPDPDVGVNQT